MDQSTPVLPWRALRAWSVRPARRAASGLLLAAALVCGLAASAQAQIAGEATVDSNLLFRGETISADNPGVTLAIGADDSSGLFAGADVSFAAGPDKPRFASSNQYAGYAWRKNKISLEVGIIHRDYWQMYDDAYRPDYVEGFVGISNDRGRVRLYVSPDYLQDGRNTYYGEVDARLAKIAGWKLNGHFGISLIPHDLTDPHKGLISYEDWGLSVTRKVGQFDFTMGAAATNYPVFGPRGNVRVRAALSRAF